MSEVNEYQVLEAYVERHGTQRAAARALGITETSISQILQRHRRVPDVVLRKLGLKRAVITREGAR